jgi:hypothetical protein
VEEQKQKSKERKGENLRRRLVRPRVLVRMINQRLRSCRKSCQFVSQLTCQFASLPLLARTRRGRKVAGGVGRRGRWTGEGVGGDEFHVGLFDL